jgi:DNA-binding protein H-NS
MAVSDADMDGMSEGELRELIERAQKALDRLVAKRARRTLKEAKRLAAEVGFEAAFTKPGGGDGRRRRKVGETEPAPAAPSSRGKVAPKYRNPDNPGETWTGRGRQPRWVQAALAGGRSLSDFAIPAEEGAAES